MKKAEWIALGAVIATSFIFVMSVTIVIPTIKEIGHVASYKHKHPEAVANGELLTELDPRIKLALRPSYDTPIYDDGLGPTIGSYHSALFQNMSIYDKKNDKLYYRFVNNGENDITLRSDLFLYALGVYKINIPPRDEVYIMISRPLKPISDVLFNINYGWLGAYSIRISTFVPDDFKKILKEE